MTLRDLILKSRGYRERVNFVRRKYWQAMKAQASLILRPWTKKGFQQDPEDFFDDKQPKQDRPIDRARALKARQQALWNKRQRDGRRRNANGKNRG